MSATRVHCPAKINLALSVGAPRDDGMHPIASWMVAVTFGDELTLTKANGESTFDITFADSCNKVDWPLEDDLTFRAAKLLEAAANRPLPIDLKLRKHIPAGAGLGGGSSNAAAVLVSVSDLYDLGLSDAALTKMALRLGSDVGYLVAAMRGHTSALVCGVGEQLEPLPRDEPIDLVLIFPGFGSPTGPVYGEFDRTCPTAPPDAERVRAIAAMRPFTGDAPFNDLADPACTVTPALGALRHELCRMLDMPVHVTGSGSTLFVVADDPAHGHTLARRIGANARATRSLASSQ